MLDIGDNPEAPQPREMIDLEVGFCALPIELGFHLIYCLWIWGHFREIGEWVERSEYKRRGAEEDILRVVWIETHPEEDTTVLRWGIVFFDEWELSPNSCVVSSDIFVFHFDFDFNINFNWTFILIYYLKCFLVFHFIIGFNEFYNNFIEFLLSF